MREVLRTFILKRLLHFDILGHCLKVFCPSRGIASYDLLRLGVVFFPLQPASWFQKLHAMIQKRLGIIAINNNEEQPKMDDVVFA